MCCLVVRLGEAQTSPTEIEVDVQGMKIKIPDFAATDLLKAIDAVTK